MYEDHYGLSGRPFQLTPDPRFWFETATHRKAMAYLGYGLSQGEGFIVITGDIGAGKTTLVGHLTGTVDTGALKIVKLVSTQVKAEDLLRTVASGMGIDTATAGVKAELLLAIERQLHAVARSGKRTLLIVDEAQALPTDSLEELRMLSNFQAGGYALLQIFLLGQPEFRERLADPRLEQLRQRVIAMHHLGPMEADELEPYLHHRLAIVGWKGTPSFSPDAIAAMYVWSGGIPRRLNQLASRVLLYGAIEERDRFSGGDLEAVTADFDNDMAPLTAAIPTSVVVEEAAEPRPILCDPVEPPPPPPPVQAVTPEPLSAPPADLGLARRLAELERRMEDQDGALRRVLGLLVDWVETGDNRPDIAMIRDGVGRG
jgi:putative secretion ATPase (PEP-CTERM system associated)